MVAVYTSTDNMETPQHTLTMPSCKHVLIGNFVAVLPSMGESEAMPVRVMVGEDALLACAVRGAYNKAVLWKKDPIPGQVNVGIIAAAGSRTTSDPRISVLHDSGMFFWIYDGKIYSTFQSNGNSNSQPFNGNRIDIQRLLKRDKIEVVH